MAGTSWEGVEDNGINNGMWDLVCIYLPPPHWDAEIRLSSVCFPIKYLQGLLLRVFDTSVISFTLLLLESTVFQAVISKSCFQDSAVFWGFF